MMSISTNLELFIQFLLILSDSPETLLYVLFLTLASRKKWHSSLCKCSFAIKDINSRSQGISPWRVNNCFDYYFKLSLVNPEKSSKTTRTTTPTKTNKCVKVLSPTYHTFNYFRSLFAYYMVVVSISLSNFFVPGFLFSSFIIVSY